MARNMLFFERICRFSRKIVFLLVLGISLSSNAAAATKLAAKVGNCYFLTAAEVQAMNSGKAAASCSKPHTVETYRVAKWTGTKDPNLLIELQRRQMISQICEPWKGNSSTFTNWSYKIPSTAEWKSGIKIVRCDAYAISEFDPLAPVIITGKKLDFK